ncbi:hypothetical protein DB346_01740 [Verrucomicrobia bacterium LW23]|nr:hypothetical protein DB346_01740 [Verrucomicrobia bacterium LW23]
MSQSLLRPITGRHKQPEVVKALIQLARHLGPNARLPRVRELSKSLKVTVVTLDQALRQLEERGLIDRRPRSGIFVSPRIMQRAIGLVVGFDIFANKDAAFFTILLEQCAKRAELNSERFSFFLNAPALNRSSSESIVHQDLADALEAGKLDGLIITSSRVEQDRWIMAQGVPVVRLGDPDKANTVHLEGGSVISLGMKELQRHGCKEIALIGVVPADIPRFRRSAAELGVTVREPWLQVKPETDSPYDTIAMEMTRALLEAKGPRPDGLLVTNDVMARGVLQTLEAAGLRIGADIQIASHANRGSLILEQWQPSLTLMEYDGADIAEAMFAILEAQIDGSGPQPARIVHPHLVPMPRK